MATVAEIRFDDTRHAAALRADATALRTATATVIRGRVTAIKTALRKQIAAAGFFGAQRLGNAFRSAVVELKEGVGVQGRVWSKAIVKRPGGRFDLITIFDEGATIRAGSGKWLALPLPGAPRKSNRRAQPSDFPQKWLVIKPSNDHESAVVAFKDRPDRPLWVLLRQVRLRKRLDVDRAFAAATGDLDDRIVKAFERAQRKAAEVAAA